MHIVQSHFNCRFQPQVMEIRTLLVEIYIFRKKIVSKSFIIVAYFNQGCTNLHDLGLKYEVEM
jgi:hypothetical protein